MTAPVPICGTCNAPWADCLGRCLTPSRYADDPTLEGLSQLADEYTSHLEIAETSVACFCTWFYRDNPIDATSLQEPTDRATLPGRKLKARSHEHPECPVHTKRGLLLGFAAWLKETKSIHLLGNPFDAQKPVSAFPMHIDMRGMGVDKLPDEVMKEWKEKLNSLPQGTMHIAGEWLSPNEYDPNHTFVEYNKNNNSCHYPGCTLTYEEHKSFPND